jgi:hypothetical protein
MEAFIAAKIDNNVIYAAIKLKKNSNLQYL